MDKKVLRSYSFIRAGNIDEEKLIIEHTINTKALDRYGTVVLPKGAKVKNFLLITFLYLGLALKI